MKWKAKWAKAVVFVSRCWRTGRMGRPRNKTFILTGLRPPRAAARGLQAVADAYAYEKLGKILGGINDE